MDSYCEYIVKKEKRRERAGAAGLVIVAAIALFIIFMMLGFVMPNFSMITILLPPVPSTAGISSSPT